VDSPSRKVFITGLLGKRAGQRVKKRKNRLWGGAHGTGTHRMKGGKRTRAETLGGEGKRGVERNHGIGLKKGQPQHVNSRGYARAEKGEEKKGELLKTPRRKTEQS